MTKILALILITTFLMASPQLARAQGSTAWTGTCVYTHVSNGVTSQIATLQGIECLVINILKVAIPILYAGCLSVRIAYTLQVVAQKRVPPSHAAIILSLEAVFAVLGGWLILGETMSLRSLFGCTLMLADMFFSQIQKSA